MTAIIKRRLLSLAKAAGLYQPLDADLTAIAGLTRTRGDLIRGGASAWEDFAAATADTFVGGNGTDVTTRTAAQVLTSLGYDTGTFTPTMSFATVGTSSWSYSEQTGIYIKIARFVWVSIVISATPTIGTGSGNLQIGALPFTPDMRASLPAYPTTATFTWPTSRPQALALTQSGVTFLLLRAVGTGQNVSSFAASNMTGGSAHTVELAGSYRVAA